MSLCRREVLRVRGARRAAVAVLVLVRVRAGRVLVRLRTGYDWLGTTAKHIRLQKNKDYPVNYLRSETKCYAAGKQRMSSDLKLKMSTDQCFEVHHMAYGCDKLFNRPTCNSLTIYRIQKYIQDLSPNTVKLLNPF